MREPRPPRSCFPAASSVTMGSRLFPWLERLQVASKSQEERGWPRDSASVSLSSGRTRPGPSKGKAWQPAQRSEPHHSTLAPLRFPGQILWSPPLGFASAQTGRTPQRPVSQPQVDLSPHDTLGDPTTTTQGDGLAFPLQGDATGGADGLLNL